MWSRWGVFSWSLLEPEEGVYHLDWLADIIHRLYQHGIHTILATPSAARPAWMAKKYPEVRRVRPDRVAGTLPPPPELLLQLAAVPRKGPGGG